MVSWLESVYVNQSDTKRDETRLVSEVPPQRRGKRRKRGDEGTVRLSLMNDGRLVERFKEDADTKRFIRIHRAQTMRLLRFGLLEVRPESSPLEPVSGSLNLTSSGKRDSFDDISRYR